MVAAVLVQAQSTLVTADRALPWDLELVVQPEEDLEALSVATAFSLLAATPVVELVELDHQSYRALKRAPTALIKLQRLEAEEDLLEVTVVALEASPASGKEWTTTPTATATTITTRTTTRTRRLSTTTIHPRNLNMHTVEEVVTDMVPLTAMGKKQSVLAVQA